MIHNTTCSFVHVHTIHVVARNAATHVHVSRTKPLRKIYRLTKSLSAGKEGSGEYKRSIPPSRPHDLTLRCRLMGKHAVDVVDVPVLPATIVLAVLVHGDLWTIEDTRLESEKKRERVRES